MATSAWRASDAGTGLVGLPGLPLAVAILLWGGGSGPYAAHSSAPPSAHVSGEVFAPTSGAPGGVDPPEMPCLTYLGLAGGVGPPDLPCPIHLGLGHCGYRHIGVVFPSLFV